MCDVSELGREASMMRRPWTTRGVGAEYPHTITVSWDVMSNCMISQKTVSLILTTSKTSNLFFLPTTLARLEAGCVEFRLEY